jgi:hypothetical protein
LVFIAQNVFHLESGKAGFLALKHTAETPKIAKSLKEQILYPVEEVDTCL